MVYVDNAKGCRRIICYTPLENLLYMQAVARQSNEIQCN